MPVLQIELKNRAISTEILKQVPYESAVFYQFIPFEQEANKLKVALVNPDNITTLEALKFIGQRHHVQTEIYKIEPQDFQKALKQYASLGKEVEKALETLETELQKKPTIEEAEKIERLAEEAPITKMVAVILRHAAEGNASDIHIEPTKKDLRVRFRLDGILHTSLLLPKKIHQAIVSRIKILANLKIDEQRKPQDGRFQTNIMSRDIDFRVSTMPTADGEKAVLRLLDPNTGVQTLPKLGLFGRNLQIIENNLKKPYGMILITGPTGSGKSTTLYAMLKILNKEGVNIVTLEDPIEYRIEGINQSQIKPEIGYTFASGLRSILRQDPDVIMVGEIRDKETAELAVHAALTGHIVLSTLHTNNAIGAVPRLIDMGVEPFLIPPSVNLIISQRLVRRISKKGNLTPLPIQAKKMFEKELKGIDIKIPAELPKPAEYHGRIGIFEVLEVTSNLEKIIIDKATERALSAEAEAQGMTTVKQDGIIKIMNGITSLEEVLKAVEE
ncbi:MAG: GspE/PulE family protein [bacterium]